jgi:hypothetical protein
MKLVDTLAKPLVTFQNVIVLILILKIIQKIPIHCPITTKLGKVHLEHHHPYYLGLLLHNSYHWA